MPSSGKNVIDYRTVDPLKNSEILSLAAMILAFSAWVSLGIASFIESQPFWVLSLAMEWAGLIIAIIALVIERTFSSLLSFCALVVFAGVVFYLKYGR